MIVEIKGKILSNLIARSFLINDSLQYEISSLILVFSDHSYCRLKISNGAGCFELVEEIDSDHEFKIASGDRFSYINKNVSFTQELQSLGVIVEARFLYYKGISTECSGVLIRFENVNMVVFENDGSLSIHLTDRFLPKHEN